MGPWVQEQKLYDKSEVVGLWERWGGNSQSCLDWRGGLPSSLLMPSQVTNTPLLSGGEQSDPQIIWEICHLRWVLWVGFSRRRRSSLITSSLIRTLCTQAFLPICRNCPEQLASQKCRFPGSPDTAGGSSRLCREYTRLRFLPSESNQEDKQAYFCRACCHILAPGIWKLGTGGSQVPCQPGLSCSKPDWTL